MKAPAQTGDLVAVGENNAAPGANVRTFLKSLSSLILNGISPSCSSTELPCGYRRGKHLPDGIVAINLGSILGTCTAT